MSESSLPGDYLDQIEKIRSRLKGRRLVLFAPTWRYSDEKSCSFSPGEFAILSAMLVENGAVLGVRLHPNMVAAGGFSGYVSSNVLYFNDIAEVNILLRETIALITDYSSIYLDFIKLNRPILLYTPDIDSYRYNRGFNYTLEEFCPHADRIDSFEEVRLRLEAILKSEYVFDSKYREVIERFHSFELDDKNAQRVLEKIV